MCVGSLCFVPGDWWSKNLWLHWIGGKKTGAGLGLLDEILAVGIVTVPPWGIVTAPRGRFLALVSVTPPPPH